MADIDFQVAFQEGEPVDGIHRFEPGSVIAGRMRLLPQKGINSRRVLARLGWHTEGRGTRASGKIEEVEVAKGSLVEGIPLDYDFAFRLPLEPWSYAGHYISIIWELAVVVDVPMARDITLSQPFVMAPVR